MSSAAAAPLFETIEPDEIEQEPVRSARVPTPRSASGGRPPPSQGNMATNPSDAEAGTHGNPKMQGLRIYSFVLAHRYLWNLATSTPMNLVVFESSFMTPPA